MHRRGRPHRYRSGHEPEPSRTIANGTGGRGPIERESFPLSGLVDADTVRLERNPGSAGWRVLGGLAAYPNT